RVLLDRYGRQLRRRRLSFAPDALQALEAYSWPGNVRELENRLKRAVIMSESHQIKARDLELESGEWEPRAPLSLRQARERAERQALQQALVYTDSSVSRAAEVLGITRPTLYSLLSKHGIKL
ncbi:helix-turn-helix domain-containing protein, partial [Arthrospira platensis SPKY1]|nr:helix-turn-helix domain-containing protein [Arthrospira platensis SPKY1]